MTTRLTFKVRNDNNRVVLEAGNWRTRLSLEETKDLYAALRSCGKLDSDAVELDRVECLLHEHRQEISSLKSQLQRAKDQYADAQDMIQSIRGIVVGEDDLE